LRQLRQNQHLSADAVLGGAQPPRLAADDDYLRTEWMRGTPRAQFATRLGITPAGVGVRARALGLPARGFRTSRARVPRRS
jgi:hypothetical protein